MPNAIRSTVALVIIHLAVTLVHGTAHLIDGVLPGPLDTAFVFTVIYVSPIVAAVLLGRQAYFAGALLLAFSMAGALLYGLAGHFLLPGADNVSQQAAGFWPLTFQITAVLLIPLEALGCTFGLGLIASTQRTRSAHQA
ncbi:MAG: hypothetical protein ACYDBJ_24985 [Aggregatilineales bacterium]